MAKSLSRKTVAKAINKCKSRSAKLLHKKAKTPAQRREVLAKAAKRCTKKKVLANRKKTLTRRKNKKNVQEGNDVLVPIPQPLPIEKEEELIEDEEEVYPPEFTIRHIYPAEFEKPGFDTMDKTPETFNNIHIIANKFMEKYSTCSECMITKFVLENEKTGNQTVFTFEPTDPQKPQEGRFLVDIYVERIPEEYRDRFEQMINDVRNADCDKLANISEEKQLEVLDVIRNQRLSHPFTEDVYEGIQKVEEIRQEECATLMPDVEFQGRVKKSDEDKIMGAFRRIRDVECDRDKIDAAFNQAENTLSNIGMFDTDPERAMKVYKELEKAKGVKEELCFEE